MISDQTRKALTFSKLKGVGPVKFEKIIKIEGFDEKNLEDIAGTINKQGLLEICRDELLNAENIAENDIRESEKKSSKIISILDNQYPEILRKAAKRPIILHVQGQMPIQQQPTVAIIGTRKPTEHGKVIAERISQFFSENGWSIVSGLALGCDTIAHRTAVKNRTHTIAVLAHGLQTISPKSNKKLSEEILSTGGALVTEYGFDVEPKPYQYAQRNLIQAGLSQGVIMIQSSKDGGSLIASSAAIKFGRTLAVPNPTDRDKINREIQIEANLVFVGNDDHAKAKLLKSLPLECNGIFVINSKEDYEILKEKLMVQFE